MSQNDPNWGRPKKNGGPPDLDEIFRTLNRKLARLLGAKSKGAPPSHPSPRASFKGSGLILLVIVVLIWLGSGFYIVDAREQGVVLRLGEFNRTADPGLQWHLPYPIEKVEIVNLTELRTVEIGYRNSAQNPMPEESRMLTSDQNIIDVQLSVQYDIKSPKAFLFNNATTDKDAQEIVKQATETAIREVVGRNKVDFVLNEGRTQIAVDTQALLQEILDRYALGVRIAKVNINAVQPPEPVLAAFDDAVKAGQDKDKLRNEGLEYANDVVPKAKGLAARLKEEAQGYRQKVVAQAEGDASRFNEVFSEYKKAPRVMRERMYLDMMQQVMDRSTKILVDQKGSNNLLYLPLDKLIQQTNPAPAGTSAPAPSSAAPARDPASEAASNEAAPPPSANAGSKGGRDVSRARDFFGSER